MTRRKTTPEFIVDAKKKYGDIYDYSKVDYKNNRTKVIIICPKHGEFQQRPDNFLNGRACVYCSGKGKLTNEMFIERAKKVHGDLYDYSKVDYKSSKGKVIIICSEHGEFQQRTDHHLKGFGCSSCSGMKKHSTKTFIKKVEEIHGDKYDYSKVDYKNNRTKVIIICPKHGEFQQFAYNHGRGFGCPQCGSSRFSKKALRWLKHIEKTNEIKLRTIEHPNGEFKIDRYYVDGFCEETNTVYEFHGDYWHGNPKIFNSDTINDVCKKTMGELYEKTKERVEYIKSKGYNLVVMWENEWDVINGVRHPIRTQL